MKTRSVDGDVTGMNKRTVFSLLLAISVVLVPQILQARYLNTGTGRFQTMDPFGGNNEDPLSLHKYLYAHDDPVNGADPSDRQDTIAINEFGLKSR